MSPRLPVLAAAALLGFSGAALAQSYKIVGPDGRVTYTDRPPTEQNSRVQQLGAGGLAAPAVSLPSVLRDAATKYPVTLYTASDCAACEMGRNYLKQRGIPFAETTVNSAEDASAFRQRFAGLATMPLLTVGAQRVEGFSQTNWSGYLDAAGYPATSKLPIGYVAPAASPLVPKPADANAAAGVPTLPRAATAQRQEETPAANVPPGFKF